MSECIEYIEGVPPPLVPILTDLQKNVVDFFSRQRHEVRKGVNLVSDERYMYVKAEALTLGLREQLENAMGEDGANMLLYNLGRALGMADCKFFSETYGLTDPKHRLFTGPIYFNYAGWAFVKFLPSVNLSPDENFLLTYDHLNSFEATGFLKAGKKTDKPVCHINAGYSSGWVSESFGLPLISREISCEAKGDKSCRFVMAHKKKIMEHLENVGKLLKM